MKEKNFQNLFNKWVKYNIIETSAFELKLSKTKSLPFSAVKEHQVNALYLSKHHKMIYKIPDDSIAQKPYDSFAMIKSKAYVVVMFYERGQKEFFLIDVDDWINEEKLSKRKSLTQDRAREIGTSCSLQ